MSRRVAQPRRRDRPGRRSRGPTRPATRGASCRRSSATCGGRPRAAAPPGSCPAAASGRRGRRTSRRTATCAARAGAGRRASSGDRASVRSVRAGRLMARGDLRRASHSTRSGRGAGKRRRSQERDRGGQRRNAASGAAHISRQQAMHVPCAPRSAAATCAAGVHSQQAPVRSRAGARACARSRRPRSPRRGRGRRQRAASARRGPAAPCNVPRGSRAALPGRGR